MKSEGPRSENRQNDAEYWASRAERTRRQASRYQDLAIQDHFMKIAAGYDALAQQARSVRGDADEIGAIDEPLCPRDAGSAPGMKARWTSQDSSAGSWHGRTDG